MSVAFMAVIGVRCQQLDPTTRPSKHDVVFTFNTVSHRYRYDEGASVRTLLCVNLEHLPAFVPIDEERRSALLSSGPGCTYAVDLGEPGNRAFALLLGFPQWASSDKVGRSTLLKGDRPGSR